MATGTAVSTGDLITAAKMNLKQETGVNLANLSVMDQSGAGSFALAFVASETLTADRNLTFVVNNAARTIDLTGNLTLAGAFTTTTGAVTLAANVAGSNVTLPASGTLATLAGTEQLSNKTLVSPAFSGTIADLGAVTTCNINGGTVDSLTSLSIRSTGSAFDLTFASTEVFTAGRTLTITLNNAARTVDLGGNLTLAGAFTTSGAFAATLTLSNTTTITLPTTGTLAILGANTFTAAQTFNGTNVDVVLNVEDSPTLDIGFDVFPTGTAVDVAFDTAETLTGALTGVNLDFSANLTLATQTNLVGYRFIHAALTQSAANTTTIYGLTIPTAGALVQNTNAGTIDWRGVNIQLPNITQTTGTVTAYGVRIIEGTTTSGTAAGILLDGTGVDTVLNLSASPIIDIGADVFETGTFMDIAFDTAETLTGALIGINVDLSSNVTISNQSVTGMDITLPSTYGAGTEYGIRVRGDGQTILIGNDADLYVSLAKASSVDVDIQGVTPVFNIGADVFETGVIFDVDFDTAETLTGALTGLDLNFNTNVTLATQTNVTGVTFQVAALTQSAGNTTTIIGYNLPTAGALIQDTAGGTISWRGVNVQLPTTTQTTGTVTAYGLNVEEGTTNSGTVAAIRSNVTLTLIAAKATTLRIAANTAAALDIDDGTTDLLRFNSQTATDNIVTATFRPAPATFASANGSTYSVTAVAASTLTLTGGTQVTALNGLGLNLGAPTVTSGSATTIVTASNLYVAAPIAAGAGPAAFTNGYSAHFASQVRVDGNISLANAAYDMVVIAATAAALEISDGTTKYLTLDTRVATDNVEVWTFLPSAPTIANVNGTTYQHINLAAYTLTLSTQTGVTALDGLQLYVSAPTVAQSGGAVTVSTASTVYLVPPTAGGSVTITNRYIINTSVAGCFLTAAGTWTDASSAEHKTEIQGFDYRRIPGMMAWVDLRTYKRLDPSDGGYERVGLIAEEVPDFLALPSRKGLSSLYVAGFALAGVKYTVGEIDALHTRIAELESTINVLRQQVAILAK